MKRSAPPGWRASRSVAPSPTITMVPNPCVACAPLARPLSTCALRSSALGQWRSSPWEVWQGSEAP